MRMLLIAALCTGLSACGFVQGVAPSEVAVARKSAKIFLLTYETAQQGILIYGSLPTCSETVKRLCKDQKTWDKIKVVEKAATAAIARATPVLNGSEPDVGQLLDAYAAVKDVQVLLADAQKELAK